jgi:hypothetical protein
VVGVILLRSDDAFDLFGVRARLHRRDKGFEIGIRGSGGEFEGL